MIDAYGNHVTKRVQHRENLNLFAADEETAKEIQQSDDINKRADHAIDTFLRVG